MASDIGKELHNAINELAKSLGIRVDISAPDMEKEFCNLMDDAQKLLDRIHIEQKANAKNMPGISNWEELSEYLEQGMDSVVMTVRNVDGSLKEVFFDNMECDEKW